MDHVQDIVKFHGGKKASNAESTFYLSVHKAGLETVDKDKIHAIIQEASKSSEFYKSEEKKLNEVKEKCKRYQERVEHVKKDIVVWERIKIEVSRKIEAIKKELNL